RRLPDADIFSTYGPEQPGIVFTPGVSLAIYLNKPVVRVEHLANLRPPRDRPQALLAVANLKGTEPMPPPGWRQGLATRTHIDWVAMLILGAASVVYAVANIRIFEFLGTPLTYPLLHVAGNFANMRSSLAHFITPGFGAALALAPLAYVMLVLWSQRKLKLPR